MSTAVAPSSEARRRETPVIGRQRRRAAIGWTVMAPAAVGIALFAVTPYLTLDARQRRVPISTRYLGHLAVLTVHAVTGSLALLTGPFQFIAPLRRRFPALHRTLGRVYLVCVFVGSTFAAGGSFASTSRLAAQVGFFLLAAAWSYSAAQALRTIRRGQVALHRRWMIRNYALTFAPVLLRVFLAAGLAYRESHPATTFADVYTAAVWASILVAHLVAEWGMVPRVHAPHAPRTGAPPNLAAWLGA